MVSIKAYLINLLFFVYFIILFAERTQSVVRSVRDRNLKIFSSGYNILVYSTVFLSLAATIVFIAVWLRPAVTGIFTGKLDVHDKIDFGMLSIAAGIILFSGMVHTEYTVPPVQFISYGALIAAIALQYSTRNALCSSRTVMWLSFAFLTALSMAIPVVYQSEIKNAGLFHILEWVVMAALVVIFTIMMRMVFLGNGDNLFCIIPIAVAVAGDALIIALRWKEKVNGFVLIFLVLSAILWIVGKAVSHKINLL